MKCRELVSVAELTTSERAAFVNAILALKTAPSLITTAATAVTAGGGTPNRYDDYVWMHDTVGAAAHFGSAFGPWHREFLRQFEFDLRQVSGNPDIVIPYWDWTTGRVSGDPNWPFTDDLLGPLGDATGIVQTGPFSSSAAWRMNIRRTLATDGVNDTNLRLRRRPAATPAGFNLPSAANARAGAGHALPYDAAPYNEAPLLDALFTQQPGETQAQMNARITAQVNAWTGASFRKFLEWVLHNGVHTWVGGDDQLVSPTFIGGPMAFPPVAVNDPAFWLHHCNIDRLWSTWQQRNPAAPYVPVIGGAVGHNLNDEMRHFEAASSANFSTPVREHPADVVDSRGVLDVWYTSDLPLISIVNSSVNFGDVPANLTTDWPVKFDVRTCRTGPARVKFRISTIGGSNFSVPAGQGDVPAEHSDAHDPVRANVFVEFHAVGTPSVVQSGTVTIGAFVSDTEGYYTGTVGSEFQVGTWTVGLQARPVPVPSAAVVLVLDRSYSMTDPVGPAGTKYDLLKSSLRVIASVMRNDDAIGLVSFDDVVATLTPAITPMGTVMPPGAGRQAVETAITGGGLTPRNNTAIGDGMIAGATLLQTVQVDPTYPTKAMVVMTDGINTAGTEPSAMSVHTAVSWFSNQVYAIGLGDETSIDTVRLDAIARYLLVTGTISSNEQRFLLTKYFLQVLAQVSNAAIVVDPMGELRPGEEHRIKFSIGDSDVSLRTIALCPLAPLLDVRLEAPDGTVIRPGVSPNVTGHVDAEDVVSQALLPAVPSNPSGTHGGEWTAVLSIRDFKPGQSDASRENLTAVRGALNDLDPQVVASVARLRALPYQLFVQTESNLKMEVEVQQASYRPGAVLTLLAGLKEYLVPMSNRAHVMVEVTDPAGAETQVTLEEVEPGRFQSTYATTIQGIYRCRFRARGTTRGGKLFQREELRTAALNAKLDTPGFQPGSWTPGGGGDQGDHKRWCALLECLLGRPSIGQFLRKHNIDPAELRTCVKRACATTGSPQRPVTDLQRNQGGAAMATDETERLRREIEALRGELRSRGAFSPGILDDLLVAGPRQIPVPPPPEVPEIEAAESHHRHPLPFLVVDDNGEPERVVIPHVMGGQMDDDPHHDPGHEHGHSDPKPPPRRK